MIPVYVIIATAFGRTNWLIHRSLASVYHQQVPDASNIHILIVDDNTSEYNQPSKHLTEIKKRVAELRRDLSIPNNSFPTRVISNKRTKNHSGTGAWNTGIFLVFKESPKSYISILDDDDEYLPNHLTDCIKAIQQNEELLCVFQELFWKLDNGQIWNFPLELSNLTPASFYVGNPGVQGSNMFIKASLLNEINGFDETFTSTTDREILIRLLLHMERHFSLDKIAIIQSPGVIHHHHQKERVTNNRDSKHKGLNRFYEKYKSQFPELQFKKSLRRAAVLFDYIQEYE